MLLDTSGLFSLHHRAEPCHVEAVRIYSATSTRLTHSYILAELVALANARRVPRPAALTFVEELTDDPDIETIWVTEGLHREAINLLRSRGDKTYSLCDAVSFVLMRARRIDNALTTDHHFEQEGFRRLLS